MMTDNEARYLCWMAYDATPYEWSIEKAHKMAATVRAADAYRWLQMRTR